MAVPSDRSASSSLGEEPGGPAPVQEPDRDSGSRSTSPHPGSFKVPEKGWEFVDRYRLEDKLATGRDSTVWRGQDQFLERSVAIKVLHLPEALDPEAVDNFRREANAVAQLAHRNIVRLFDAGVDAGLHYLVMEYLEGGSLADRLEERRFDAKTAAALAYQVADGLAAAHQEGFAHRDVKPSNILLTAGGEAKLADFGVVRHLRRATTISSQDTFLGTTRYLAPEQVEGHGATPAADVYSLGLVLWEAWTGQAAFERDTPAATALARLHKQLARPSQVRPGIPDELDVVITTAVAIEPDDRFATGEAMREALRELVGPHPEQATAALAT